MADASGISSSARLQTVKPAFDMDEAVARRHGITRHRGLAGAAAAIIHARLGIQKPGHQHVGADHDRRPDHGCNDPQNAHGLDVPAEEVGHAGAPAPAGPLPSDFKSAVAGFEHDLLTRALGEARHNQRVAAKRLGLGYHQFRNMLREHGLLPSRSPAES